MSNDQITFSCTSCGVELNVPLSYAGISGPCPGCQATITAPKPEEQKPEPQAAPTQEQAPPQPSPPTPVATVPSPTTTPAPEQQKPLSAPAAAILAATPAPPKKPTSVPSPAPALETPTSFPPAPSSSPPVTLSNESPAIPDFSIPSVSPQASEAPAANDKFPSATTNNQTAAKTVLPPRRAEVELPAPLAQPNSAPFPSALIPPTSIPANQVQPLSNGEATIREVPSQEEIPVLEQRPETTREVTPPPEPVAPTKPATPAFLGGTPSPAVPQATPTPVPQAEPQSGSTAYPVSQPSTPVAYPAQPAPPVAAPPVAAPPVAAPPTATPPTATPPTATPPTATPPTATPPTAATPGETTAAPPVSHGLSTFSAPPKEAPAKEEPKQKKPKGKLWWLRIVIPILFLALCGLVVYLVTDLLQKVANDGSENRQLIVPTAPNATARQEAKERVATNDSAISETNFSNTPKRLDPVSADVDSPKLYVEGEPPPTIASSTKRKSAPITDLDPSDAASVLDRFLNANSLEERLPFLSRSKRSQKELSNSSLAKPLPEVLHSRLLHYMVNNSERHTEHFFEVSFQKEVGERPYPILIQINDWGEGQCKIHTDAFLDLFEDQLSQFASKPVAGTRTFHIVADAYKHCFDEIIPDWDKKSFLKLRNHPRMSPRLIAYFNRNSQMAEEISRPDSLPWGESGICTVTVAWNMENPENPFVELIDVVGFTWEP